MVEGAKKQGGKGRILIGKDLNCKPRYPVSSRLCICAWNGIDAQVMAQTSHS